MGGRAGRGGWPGAGLGVSSREISTNFNSKIFLETLGGRTAAGLYGLPQGMLGDWHLHSELCLHKNNKDKQYYKVMFRKLTSSGSFWLGSYALDPVNVF